MIQYAPVARIADYAGSIIEELRSQYPDSGDHIISELRVNVAGSPSNIEMAQNEVRQWRMTNANGDFGFVFGEDRIVFQTTAYRHFQGFADQFAPVVEVISKLAKISHSKDIGIRHIDNIFPIDDLDFSDLLRPGYLCPAQNEALLPASSRVEYVYRSNLGHFFARCYQVIDHPKLPQDLFQLGSQLPNARLMEPVPETFVLADTDHMYHAEKFEEFDLQMTLEKLEELHEQNSIGFRSMVTEEAIAAWRLEKNND